MSLNSGKIGIAAAILLFVVVAANGQNQSVLNSKEAKIEQLKNEANFEMESIRAVLREEMSVVQLEATQSLIKLQTTIRTEILDLEHNMNAERIQAASIKRKKVSEKKLEEIDYNYKVLSEEKIAQSKMRQAEMVHVYKLKFSAIEQRGVRELALVEQKYKLEIDQVAR